MDGAEACAGGGSGRSAGDEGGRGGRGQKWGPSPSEEACALAKTNLIPYTHVNLRRSISLLAGKLGRQTAEINHWCGAQCGLCGPGQRPLALMMRSEPMEACKSAAGTSSSLQPSPPTPHPLPLPHNTQPSPVPPQRYPHQSHLRVGCLRFTC